MKLRRNNRLLFIILLMISTLGFALLSSTLQIIGITKVKGNVWNIHWDEDSIYISNESIATATGPDVETVVRTDDTVAFEVNLELPGEYLEFIIDAVNEGTVDGIISYISKSIYDKDDYEANGNNATKLTPSNLIFTVVYDDNGEEPILGDVLAKRVDSSTPTRRTYKIRVEYDEQANESTYSDVSYICVYKVTYGQNASAGVPSSIATATATGGSGE